LIDPIDGTSHFARGEDGWAVLLSFVRQGRVEVGVISMPALGCHFWAGAGLGAYTSTTLDAGRSKGIPMLASPTRALADAGVLYQRAALDGVGRAWMDAVASAGEEGPLLGPVAVASGRADAMVLGGELDVWEVAPVSILVTEAGGSVTDFRGKPDLSARRCLVSSRLVHEALLEAIRDDFAD